jgi:hypothetical protein
MIFPLLFANKKRIALTIGVVIILALLTYAYLNYIQAQKAEQQTAQKDAAAIEAEAKDLVAKVSQLIDLPNETPTVATVTDKSKLAGQPFFAKSENGDKVLIFKDAKKAVLYRPSTNKVIDIGPVNLTNDTTQIATSSAQPTATPIAKKVNVILSNGTKTSGLASKYEADLVKNITNVVVTQKTNTKSTYDKSVIVVLNEGAKNDATKISEYMKIPVGNLPTGETKPATADVLIIIGKDKI